MRIVRVILLCLVLILASSTLFAQAQAQTYADFTGGDKVFAVQTGDIYESFVRSALWCESPLLFQNISETAEAVRMGRADAAMMTEDAIPSLIESGVYSDLEFLPVSRDEIEVQSAPVFGDSALAEKFNAFLAGIIADGTLEEMNARYLMGLPDYEDIPKIELTGENGTLTVADTGTYPPMSYMGENGEMLGYDMELAQRFAQYLGMDLNVKIMAYDGVLPSVVSGNTDMSACFYVVTEEREEGVIFGDVVTRLGAVLMVKKQNGAESTPGAHTAAYEDFAGKRFSILVGSVFDEVADSVFAASEKLYFNNTVEEIEAVRLNKTDAALMDNVAAAQALQTGEYEELMAISVDRPELYLEYGVFSTDQSIIDRYNEFLAEIEADGTLVEMQNRWLTSYAFDAVMPEITLSGENGTLTAAIMATYPPFTFAGNGGAFSGFDIEQLRRFAAWLGMDIEFVDMDFGAMLSYVASGKADIGGSVYATDERKESFIFGNPDYVSETVLVVRKEDAGLMNETAEQSYADFLNTQKAYGCVVGDVYGSIADTEFGASSVTEYESIGDGIIALRNGRIDAFAADFVDLWLPEKLNEYEDIEFLTIPTEVYVSNIAPIFATEDLRDSFNAFAEELKAAGTLDKMFAFWFGDNGLPAEETVPRIQLTGENGTLRCTIDSGNAAQGYKDSEGRYVGYSVELAERFAMSLGMDIEWIDCDMLTALTYLQSGKSDMLGNLSTKTDSRVEQMLYGDTIIEDSAMLIVRKQHGEIAPARDFKWFTGKLVGINMGSLAEAVLLNFGATPAQYQETVTGVEDVRNGRIAGFASDLSALNVMAREPENAQMEVIEIPASYFTSPMGAIASFENQALIDEFNIFLAAIKADGSIEEMKSRWFEGVPDLDAPMPELTYTGEKGVLKVATVGTDLPFDYFGADNELKGYAIELMNRFAAQAGYTVDYQAMDFGGQIPAVVGGRADMAISCISISEERKQSVLFTDSVYDDLFGIIALKETAAANTQQAAEDTGLAEWLKNAIERNLITENRWRMIVDGLGVTMTISLLAQVLGTLLGCLLCWVLTRKSRLLSGLGKIYSGLIHGLPMVVLLMISYYIIFGKSDIPAMLIAVCAFALVEAAGVADNLKGAIDTVDPVEIEAARSIGFTAVGAFRTVTLPQAVKRALPAYCNGFIELVKATAIVGYIAIQDMTRAGDIIRSRTYDAFFPLLFVAAIYLVVTTMCVQLFKWIVKRLGREVRQ